MRLLCCYIFRREASACLIMLSAIQDSHWCHFNVFGNTRPRIEPTIFPSEADTLTLSLSGPVNFHTLSESVRAQKNAMGVLWTWAESLCQIHRYCS